MSLVLEQHVVERPEASLGTGRFGRFGSEFSMGMGLDLRVVSKHESYPLAEMLEYGLHRRVRLTTRRAFKVAVFDDVHLCGRRARDVVGCLVWRQRRVNI